MRLLIISHTPHYRTPDGVVGWGPTIREIDALATIFKHVVHLAPMYDDQAPASALPYAALNITHVPVVPAGGDGVRSKLDILRAYPSYAVRMLREMRRCDVVHVRFPANISLLALLLLYLRRSPEKRWFKYAGNWFGRAEEPLAYRVQRLLLQPHLHGGIVTVNAMDSDRHQHIRVFRNPSFSIEEYNAAAQGALLKPAPPPVRILFCGRMEREKGVLILCRMAVEMHRKGVDFHLDFIGEGRDREMCASLITAAGIERNVQFSGWMTPMQLTSFYKDVHFIVLPSASEGWPKVLSEAMAWGAVPIASNVSSIPRILDEFQCGSVIASFDHVDYAEAVLSYVQDCERWKREREAAVKAAVEFTYEMHIGNVQTLLRIEG